MTIVSRLNWNWIELWKKGNGKEEWAVDTFEHINRQPKRKRREEKAANKLNCVFVLEIEKQKKERYSIVALSSRAAAYICIKYWKEKWSCFFFISVRFYTVRRYDLTVSYCFFFFFLCLVSVTEIVVEWKLIYRCNFSAFCFGLNAVYFIE